MTHRDSWTEEKTRPDGSSGRVRASTVVESEPPSLDPNDPLHQLGKVMASQAVVQRDVQTLSREVRELRKELADDREERGGLVHSATRSAARHGGNRSAALVAALFALWEVASPVIHEIGKLVHQ